ncbi:sigma factor-like helix-turn-helix DNA-binding protein [Streptomyces sp. MMBL 11-1]|uniref:sigma factor-like helix-turn-helix DNA-binding protein n=1 Tax=Streptomyces sp. MMBL 11-1 TaxID=3026420 RepID=UPI00235E0AEF|nr:sigma factor-like helix-turn-helix DNA-binding protein [Streptomyces sp. MMBL 11-1]
MGANKPKAVIAEEAAECFRLQLSGLTYRGMAKETGLSVATVHKRVRQALTAVIVPAVEELRTREGERLLYLLERLQPAVEAGDLDAIKTAARLSESYRKLMGLNAPEQHSLQIHEVTQNDLELQDMIRAAQAKAQLTKETQG